MEDVRLMHIFFWREGTIFKELLTNGSITDKEVRLIDEHGIQLGVMSKAEAQRIADFRNLDLVNISPAAKPPVCKIMDYGKYRFDMIKKDKEAIKAQKAKIVEVKEIRLSQNIDSGDVQTKAKHAINFLKDGNKVKVTLRMYGRQLSHTDISVGVLNGFYELVKEYAVIDKNPTMEGRAMIIMLSPIKK